MKRLFNKLLIPVMSSLVILPIANCSSNEKKQSDTIEIISSIDDVTLVQNQDFLSKPLVAKCFDSQRQEKFIYIDFKIQVKGFDTKPDWISLTSKNEIRISGINDVQNYEISIIAFNEQEKIYSQPLTFKINVVSVRHIIPDSISLEIENDKYCMYGEETIIPINIVPFKQSTEEKYLIKDCSCEIEVLHGNELFEIGGTSSEPVLIISKDTDKSNIGSYSIKITATLLKNPQISASKTINVNIDNIYSQYNSQCKCTFTRSSADENWTLSTMSSESAILYKIPTIIQNKPVTKIAANLCQKSQVTHLVQIILPSTIIAIGEGAFANQSSLCSMEIPGVKYVANSAFENDPLLEFRLKGEKPSFYYIGTKAFYGCGNLKFEPQYDLIWIGDYAFKNAGLQQFEIGQNCYYIGCESFAECSNFSSFKIWCENPPEIGGANFHKCDKLLSIKVPYESLDEYQLNPYWSNLGKTIEGFQ